MMTASFKYLLIIFLIFGSFLLVNSLVRASGGDNDECEDAQETSFEDGDEDEMEYTAPEGQIVSGVCIKSGNNMFSDGHSESLEDGDYEDGCYTVEGVGTNTVVVERNFESDTCQGISHLDIYTDDQNNNEEGDGDEDEEDGEENDQEEEEGNGDVEGDEENGNEEDEENNGQSEEESGAEDEGNQDPPPTPTPAPSESPTPTPTPTPDPTTSPTPTPSPSSSDSSTSSSTSSSQSSLASETPRPSPQGQILGVSTLAQTGIFEDNVLNSIFALGILLLSLGAKRYAQKNR